MTDKVQIVGLGLATLDVLIRTQNMPDWEHGGRFDAFGFDGGGPVGTAMCAASRLGARVGFVGTAGNDHVADLKVELLAEFDMDLSHLVRRDQPEDQVVIVYVDSQTGERVFSGFGRPRQNLLRPDELDKDYILGADYIHLEGMHPEAAVQAAKWRHEAGKPVVLDGSKTREPDVRPHLRELSSSAARALPGHSQGVAMSMRLARLPWTWARASSSRPTGPKAATPSPARSVSTCPPSRCPWSTRRAPVTCSTVPISWASPMVGASERWRSSPRLYPPSNAWAWGGGHPSPRSTASCPFLQSAEFGSRSEAQWDSNRLSVNCSWPVARLGYPAL